MTWNSFHKRKQIYLHEFLAFIVIWKELIKNIFLKLSDGVNGPLLSLIKLKVQEANLMLLAILYILKGT